MRIRVKELLDRSINILEKTKQDMDKYSEERKKVNYFMIHYKDCGTLSEWEYFLDLFERKVREDN